MRGWCMCVIIVAPRMWGLGCDRGRSGRGFSSSDIHLSVICQFIVSFML
ncbi:hypothetical protein LSH36_12g35000 [Paralvinella palmiformis]|uniref:Uncharacterized protein n=1 Tax=Paralvinella palmiformis TaxID=53620 RepID=A0AAD9NGI1_9ANNE|nr:hypothetical protein LSH36_12g35000 [Paralvinella palmiformis]